MNNFKIFDINKQYKFTIHDLLCDYALVKKIYLCDVIKYIAEKLNINNPRDIYNVPSEKRRACEFMIDELRFSESKDISIKEIEFNDKNDAKGDL